MSNAGDRKGGMVGWRQWLCMVAHSGYHNGARCNPRDPHGGDWECGWYYVASPIKAPTPRPWLHAEKETQ